MLMAEPDHIYLRPLPNFMRGDKPAGFNFGYMNPAGDENCPIVKRWVKTRMGDTWGKQRGLSW